MSAAATLHRIPRHPHAWLAWAAASQLLVLLLWWRLGWTWGLPALLLTHAAFIVPVFLPRVRLYAPVVTRLPAAGRQVWLTIDDGPSDDTPAILEALARHGARATFFLVGERALARPELVTAILEAGHEVANHTHTHPQFRFWALGPRAMAEEVGQAQRTLAALAGSAPRWFRAVAGHTNPFVAAPLRAHRLTRVAWTTRGYDAVDGDPVRVLQRLRRGLRPGAIVLLHEGARHGRSVELVEAALCLLREQGYATVIPD
ncbi:polysaccharide deacetylase family protein [Pseudoxanthomonas taiwanensis]|jgi:Predicted xylanase/chitin deacetylase|uniref:Acetyl xylan esterase n=1 Tax=Pseudoxanthomonas taiwanensis TaxID=176598 RepID=A0A921TGM9_9GAMM|nr:polysaccharide deacetylase family protein [Pseudoxanthomonas taiwanensis]KAF1690684.1 acetyl xylan esterase [Pseudoxanthomonas taiwanensis]MBO2468319.1 polysaccharide deacetylase family protein [Xanthomonadaceae bacterium]